MKKDKVLLVEDDSTLSFIVEDALRREGFDVVCASNGETGLRMFKEAAPDIIVSDVMMPIKWMVLKWSDSYALRRLQSRFYSLRPGLLLMMW
ncbi:MAG: response regulator [Muribaculaceae bacterium]